jgi:transcriptional regulator with XRE-family HTH domain
MKASKSVSIITESADDVTASRHSPIVFGSKGGIRMIIKRLRQQRYWSQEQLAESSGLSLRTIQRVESSNKLSFESLRGLAAVFEIEVATLERELVMDKSSGEWKRRPLWVRAIFFGSGKIRMDRHEFQKVEVFAAIAGVVFIAAGVCGYLGYFLAEQTAVPLLFFGSLLFLCAYLMSIAARVGDSHSVWPWLESSTEAD